MGVDTRRHQVPFFGSLIWLDQGLNPNLPVHCQTFYSLWTLVVTWGFMWSEQSSDRNVYQLMDISYCLLLFLLVTFVEGDPKAPFSMATIQLYPWSIPYNADDQIRSKIKQEKKKAMDHIRWWYLFLFHCRWSLGRRYISIISIYNPARRSKKENCLTLRKIRSKRYHTELITDEGYADDLALLEKNTRTSRIPTA